MTDATIKPEFWEQAFREKHEMWGLEPAKSAILTRDFFVEKGLEDILIPGIGYGRNAQIFRDAGMSVTGIEISETAIEMAREHYGADMNIYHGSVTDLPFDDRLYDGVFCYGLIHLLDTNERTKLIQDCYNQLSEDGYMIFVAIATTAHIYGKGRCLSKDRYENLAGVAIYFYDRESIQGEFEQFGLIESTEVTEGFPFWMITCKK